MEIQENIRIYIHPGRLPFMATGGIGLMVSKDITENEITMFIDPTIIDYQEAILNGTDVQLVLMGFKNKAKNLKFDFKNNNVHIIKTPDQKLEIKLMNIDSEIIEGKEVKYVDFFIQSVQSR